MKEIIFTQQNIQYIKSLYESGVGTTSIPKQLNLPVSWGTINRLVKENGWSPNYVDKRYNRLVVKSQYKEQCSRGLRTRVECLCDCGNTKHALLSNVKNGHVKSCGCLLTDYNTSKRKEYGWSAFNLVYNGYINNARHGRGGQKEFRLTKDEAKKLFTSPCFYCGALPSKVRKIKRGYGEFVYNGIDRKDSAKGYTIDNCVSCCEFCNMTKNDTPFDDFIKWIRRVYKTTETINI